MSYGTEMAYELGNKAAWRELLSLALSNLGTDAPTEARLAKERADTVAALRSLCATHGDNEWPDDLHLADVIGKHLAPFLADPEPDDASND